MLAFPWQTSLGPVPKEACQKASRAHLRSDSQQKTPERDCQKAIANDVSQEVAQKAVQSLAKGKAKLPQASVGDEAALSVSAQIADLKNQINVGKRKASEKDLPEKKEESKKRQKKKESRL